VATTFAAADSGESGENLSQGLLYLFNENGFPHLQLRETVNVINLCKDLMNVENPHKDEEDGDEGLGEEGGLGGEGSCGGAGGGNKLTNFARGHFYTNDVKVRAIVVWLETNWIDGF
jgi:hypothetical protein